MSPATINFNGGTVTNSGTIEAEGGSVTFTGTTIENTGTLKATGGELSIDATSTIDNTAGIVEAAGGTVDIQTALTGGNAYMIAARSKWGPRTDTSITFLSDLGGGTLKVDASATLTGSTVSASLRTTRSNLANLTYSGTATDVWDQSAGTLTVSNNGVTDIIHLAGTYTQSEFALAPDSGTGTDIVLPASGVAPTISTENIALVSQNSFGGSGEHQGAAVTYATAIFI